MSRESVILIPGQRVERYVVRELLGSGGMGQVYRAFDPRLQRHVALKLLHLEAADQGRARILREARAAAALEHANVVAVYDAGEIEEPGDLHGTMYLTMELVRGRSLRDLVGDANVPLEERMRWLADVARALGAAHSAGLVHRDIKPENVMLREDGVVKVLDFGIARRSATPIDPTSSTEAFDDALKTQGLAIGTPLYMAPEQMRGQALDGRADQFSWAVMAYEILTGALPWSTTGDALSLVAEVLSHEPPPLAQVAPEVPAWVSDAIMRAMSKVPGARFGSMRDLLKALSDAQIETCPTEPRYAISTPRAARDANASANAFNAVLSAPTPAKPAGSRARRAILALFAVALTVCVATVVTRQSAPPPSAATLRPSTPACVSNAACTAAAGGVASVCHHDTGACAPLAPKGCALRADADDVTSDDTIWFGAMLPLTGPEADNYGRFEADALELARRDFASELGRLREAGLHGRLPRFGLISCDEAGDSKATIHALVEDARAPAIIGFTRGDEVVDGASILAQRGALAMVTLATSAVIGKIPQQASHRLVWRTAYDLRSTAEPIALLAEQLLEPARASRKPFRVAVVREDLPALAVTGEFLFGRLRFNGKSALENGDDYVELVQDPDSATRDDEVVATLTRMRPDLIVLLSPRPGARVMARVERAWPAGERRPVVVTPNVLGAGLVRLARATPGGTARYVGLTNSSTTTANARLAMHYERTFHVPVARTDTPNSTYDGFYVLAYAALAAGDAPVTGASLAAGIAKLQSGAEAIEVGPTGIFDAVTRLRRGEKIDLHGAMSSLDFDLATGESPVDLSFLCATPSGEAPTREAGLLYKPASRALVGSLRCP